MKKTPENLLKLNRESYYRHREKNLARRLIKYRSIEGIASESLKSMRRNSIKRGHNSPCFSTTKELSDWIRAQNNITHLMAQYEESKFERFKRPSVDRLENNRGYSLDNIRLVSWGDNLKAYTSSSEHRNKVGYNFRPTKKEHYDSEESSKNKDTKNSRKA